MLAAFLDQQQGRLLLWFPVAFGCGIAWYFSQKIEPALAPVGWLCLGAILCAVLLRRRVALHAIAVLLSLSLIGAMAAMWQTERVRAPVLAESYNGPVMGRLVRIDRSEQNKLRLWLDQVHLPGISAAATPLRVRIVTARPPSDHALFAGARLTTTARLGPPPPPVEPQGFDFRRHAWFLSLGAIGYATEPVVLAAPRGPPQGTLRIFDARLRLAQALRDRMPDRTGGFAAAILTGERSGVDPADLVGLRASNLAHLLAISGLHMGLLCGVVFGLVRGALVVAGGAGRLWPAKKIAAVAAIGAGAAYLILSGGAVATQRAYVMAAVVFFAVILDRPALTLRAVAVAALIVMALRPVALMGPGFQMSFAATVALIATYDAFKRWPLWLRLNGVGGGALRWVIGLVLTALVAGAATAPFSAFHFNQLTSYGLIANVLAVPAMGLLVMPAALFAFILWPFGLEAMPLAAMDLGIRHILFIANWTAGLDGAVRPVASGPGWALVLIAVGGLVLAAVRGPVRVLGCLPMAIAVAGWSLTERPYVLVAPQAKIIGVQSADGRALSAARGQGFAARVWLENDGDPVDQAVAANRAWDGDVVLWTKAHTPDPGLCAQGRLLVAPKLKAAPGGGCAFLGASSLGAEGAHAFYRGKLSRPLTTRQVVGTRPWSQP